MKAYRYRLYPTNKQETLLLCWLELCRRLYNYALTERRAHYKQTGHGLSYRQQQNSLPAYKAEHPEYAQVHSQTLQNVLVRLDRAFQNFFQGRTKYPRFKRFGEYQSITYPQLRSKDVGANSIVLSKIGRVKMVKHRPIKGTPTTLTVIRLPCGRWYASITAELAPKIKAETKTVNKPVGVDSGLTNFIYLSDGTHIDNPHFLNNHEKRIKKAQRRLSNKRRFPIPHIKPSGNPEMRWSNNGLKAKTILARRWQKYVDVKDDWQWQQAHKLVEEHDFIVYEDLPIPNMLKNHSLARSIQDASWGGFWGKVENLATQTDSTRTQPIGPNWTTMRCNRCEQLNRIALSERTFRCSNCGYAAPRDHNAAQNIKEIALEASGLHVMQPVGMGDPELTPAETETTAPETERSVTVKSLVAEAGSKGFQHADRNTFTGGKRIGKPTTTVMGGCHPKVAPQWHFVLEDDSF